mgnify:CR=1 FL=1
MNLQIIEIHHPNDYKNLTFYLIFLFQYNEFVINGIDSLDKSRLKMQNSATTLLTERLNQCFDPVKARADKFADWYFAYRSVLHNRIQSTIWGRELSITEYSKLYTSKL